MNLIEAVRAAMPDLRDWAAENRGMWADWWQDTRDRAHYSADGLVDIVRSATRPSTTSDEPATPETPASLFMAQFAEAAARTYEKMSHDFEQVRQAAVHISDTHRMTDHKT